MENEKEKGEEREEREGEIRAGADSGDDCKAGRPRSAVACAHGRGHRERGRGGWKSDVWNRERFRELGLRVLGGF